MSFPPDLGPWINTSTTKASALNIDEHFVCDLRYGDWEKSSRNGFPVWQRMAVCPVCDREVFETRGRGSSVE